MARSSRRGWVVALAGFGINLALGVLYAWSVIAKELTTQWGWSAERASAPYAVAIAFFASVLVFGGRAQDRLGPRLVASAGGVLVSAGLLVSSLASPQNSMPLVLGFGVLSGSGIALGFISTFPPAAKWFPAKQRGLATGLVVSGFGIASVYIAPLTQYLLEGVGVSGTLRLLGLLFLPVTLGLAQLLKNPSLQEVVDVAAGETTVGITSRAARTDLDWHQMIRTRPFWMLWLMYGLTAFAGMMIIGHMAKITQLQTGLDLGFALVAVLAVGNAAGRIAAGIVSDRIGPVSTMRIVFALQALVMVSLAVIAAPGLLTLAAFLVGFNYGADLSLFPCAVSEFFGQRNQGVNYGAVFTSWGLGGVFGSMVAAAIVDSTGSYRAAFLLAASLCAVATGLTLLTAPPGVRTSRVGRLLPR